MKDWYVYDSSGNLITIVHMRLQYNENDVKFILITRQGYPQDISIKPVGV